MDATHFRTRAANARELAGAGEDLRLAQMLLDVAADLDAEAEAIEAEQRTADRLRLEQSLGGSLVAADGTACREPAQILDISVSGAKLTADRRQDAGSAVILKFPSGGVQLEGTIVPLRDSATAAVAVDRESRPSAGPAHRLQADDPVSTPSLQAVN